MLTRDASHAVTIKFDRELVWMAADRSILHVLLMAACRGIDGNHDQFTARVADIAGLVMHVSEDTSSERCLDGREGFFIARSRDLQGVLRPVLAIEQLE